MKIIENAYSTVRETLDAIYRLVEEDEHKLSDIVVVTNSEKRAKFINSSPVEVVAIPTETYQSIWSSIQTLFKDKKGKVLKDYGVDETSAREYVDAIRYGQYVVLVEEKENYDDLDDPRHRREENKSRLQDAKRNAMDSMKKFGSGLDLDDPDENKSFGRNPQQ